MKPWKFIAAGVFLAMVMPPLPSVSTWHSPAPVVVAPVEAVDRTTTVYDVQTDSVTPAMRAGVSALEAKGIKSDFYELNDSEEVKPGYALAVEAAKKHGTPLLVVMAGGKVVRVVKSPATEAAYLEAVR